MKEQVKAIIPEIILLVIGAIVLGSYAIWGAKTAFDVGVHRIIIALAAAAVSIGLPGMISIGKPEASVKTLPTNLKATGALAVFIIVYLFNPVN